MKFFKRAVIQSMFFEILDEIIQTKLAQYNPQKSYLPIPEHDEYEVDYCFKNGKKPIFLSGVNNISRARLVTLSYQHFLLQRINFRGVVVLESLDILGKKDQARLMSVADKQFPSTDDFRENALLYLEREFS